VREKLVTDVASYDTACGGGTFSYQNVNTALMGAVLERVYGQPLEALLSEKIWKPAGAADADWRRTGSGAPVTPYCCLFARPIDWLKVAIYLSNNGTPGAPFLPDAVWRQFTGADITAAQRTPGAYRNFIYYNQLDRPGETLSGSFTYFMGSQGQMVYLMPSAKLVVVRFGSKFQKLHSTLYEIERSMAK
jgi:CubicO group peptidase (beta-lactamase class C family)